MINGVLVLGNLLGNKYGKSAIRCGQDQPDEYGKLEAGQEVKRGVATRLPNIISPP